MQDIQHWVDSAGDSEYDEYEPEEEHDGYVAPSQVTVKYLGSTVR